MHFLRKIQHIALVTLLLGVLLAIAQPAQAQKRGGTLKYIVPASDFPSMDAHRETTFAVVHPIAPFYSLLMRLDPLDPKGQKLAGDLAEKYTVSKDKKTYTFTLHKGVKFHDGTPLTARDVVASYQKIINPPEGVHSPRKAFFLMVDKVEAPNDNTVVFTLSFPTGAFLPAISMPYNFIYSADQLKKDIHWFEKNVNGSGPFKLVENIPGDKVTGVRNENYFKKGLPYLDGFEASFADKSNVIVQAMKGGRIHSMFRGFSPDEVEDIVKTRGKDVVVSEAAWNCVLLVAINHHKKPFDDQRFRRALNLGIDRWGGSEYLSKIAIVKTVGGVVFPHDDLAPSKEQLQTLEGYWPDINKSRAKAKELLKEAGVPEGFKFVLKNRSTDQPYKFVATWLIDQWRQ
ncbi:MAG: ABC transporter substrate-binding protein, partial [Deltaproteobacteria bacterium]|nr:ABC transporter substrate-binding protein [Deltaproteobacteria bacterium]